MTPRQSSPAVARNTGPILEILRAHMPARGRVLEVACGSGEHAVAFSTALPGLDWTPTDPDPGAVASAADWRRDGPGNLGAPLRMDATDEASWPDGVYEAIFCANMVHISPWSATEGLMRLAGTRLVRPGGLLVLYGPYLEGDLETAASNLAFDESLKARDPSWGLRDRDAVVQAAMDHGLALTRRVEMPANNLILLLRRT